MSANFDYEGAKNAGYSDGEIQEFLASSSKGKKSSSDQINPKFLKYSPNFDVEGAMEAGYSANEINEHLSSLKPKKSKLEKAGRIGTQLGIGAAESALLPYEISVAPLSSKEAQTAAYRENLGEDIENLLMQKQAGIWSAEDEDFLQNLMQQMNDPEKSEQFINTADIGVRALTEKATGLDLHPEGTAEKAANWIGFIKDPKKIIKAGLNPKQLFKAIAPSGTELLRGAGAGTALEMAEDGQFGPMGTMAMAILGDVAGSGLASGIKGAKNLITKPKETLAKVAASFTSKDKLALQKELIKDFEKSGLQADLGTLTDSNLIKGMQARLSQSSLTGKSLDKFKNELTEQIKEEYKALADSLGEAKYSTLHEAGEVAKEGIKSIRDADLAATRQLYKNADKALKEGAYVNSSRLAEAVGKIEKQLQPGKLKSVEQKAVLDAIENIKKDLYDASGRLRFSDVKNLMNDKIALQDIINYEVQGGTKQLLKGVVNEIDRAIISHGKENATFAKNYVQANKKFSEHAKTFRNRDVDQLLRESDPAKLMNRMNSIHGIIQVGNILSRTPQGKEIFKNLKRTKLEKAVGDHLVDNTTQQVKLGTFSKLLEKGKNKEIIREILGPKDFQRLQLLQKNAGKLADAANKFFNASQSGVVAADAAVLAKVLSDVASLFMGSPWPIVKMGAGLFTVRKFSNLIADPEFLKLVEDVIKNSGKSNRKLFLSIEKLRPYLLEGINQSNEISSQMPTQ